MLSYKMVSKIPAGTDTIKPFNGINRNSTNIVEQTALIFRTIIRLKNLKRMLLWLHDLIIRKLDN